MRFGSALRFEVRLIGTVDSSVANLLRSERVDAVVRGIADGNDPLRAALPAMVLVQHDTIRVAWTGNSSKMNYVRLASGSSLAEALDSIAKHVALSGIHP